VTDPRVPERLPLSLRETSVLELVSLGLSNDQIGRRLGVSVHAVKFHLASIYRKLGVANRTQAAATFLRAAGALGTGEATGEVR
jgi:ATP/maltotriose-dependent transcriptional regulator MalT